MAKTSRTIKTAVLSTGKALTSLSSIVTAMVLIRLFSKEDWGTYRQTMLVFIKRVFVNLMVRNSFDLTALST